MKHDLGDSPPRKYSSSPSLVNATPFGLPSPTGSLWDISPFSSRPCKKQIQFSAQPLGDTSEVEDGINDLPFQYRHWICTLNWHISSYITHFVNPGIP
ncbi:hypothetical protein ScPMuIL_007784 [Solemya velum]